MQPELSEPQTLPPPQATQKSAPSPLMIIGSLLALFLIAGGAYYLGTLRSTSVQPTVSPAAMVESTPSSTPQANPSMQPSALPLAPPVATQDVANWRKQTFAIKKQTDFGGKETISLTISHPADWTLETVNQPLPSATMYAPCDEFLLKDTQEHMLSISYPCASWNGGTEPKPSDAVIIATQLTGRADRPADTIMRFWTNQKNYWYVSGDGKAVPTEFVEALLLPTDRSAQAFIPLLVTFANGQDQASLTIADKIILGLSATSVTSQE